MKSAAMAKDGDNVNIGDLFDIQCNAIDLQLIELVKDRPALYDIRVPQKDRTKGAKEALWDEISQSLQRKIKPVAAEMRWKYLRENYIKARRKQALRDEIAIKTGEPTKSYKYNRRYAYRYHEQMLFLNDALDHQKTAASENTGKLKRRSQRSAKSVQQEQIFLPDNSNSQISNDGEEPFMETDALFDHQYEAIAIPIEHVVSKKEHYLSHNSTTIENEVPDNEQNLSLNSSTVEVQNNSNGNVNYEQLFLNYLNKTAEKPSPIDGFLIRLGEGLRRLPYRERSKLELEFLSRLNEVEDQLGLLN